MSNRLEFTLGLVTGGFLSELGHAGEGVKGFIGGMISMGAITAGVMHAIETGAGLEHLQKRTGESVENLVKLQSGFKAAGLAADDVAPALFIMQKSLGGVNEFGQGTASTFNRMGLSISKLKAMGAPQALSAILGSLKKMNQSDAVKAASVIFGRGESGNMLQLARSSGEFAEGTAKAASKAKLFGDNVKAFEMVDRAAKSIKGNMETMFAGIAVGITPALLTVEKKLASLDLAGFGKNLGDEITMAFEAIDLGQFGEYFRLTLESAAFDVGNFVGAQLQKALAPPTKEDEAAGKGGFFSKYAHAMLGGAELTGSILPLLAGAVGIPGGQKLGDSLVDKAYANYTTKAFDATGKIISLGADMGEAYRKGGLGAGPNPYAEQLAAMRAGLLSSAKSKVPKENFEDTWKRGAPQAPEVNYKPDFTQLEKMGFVMSGLGNADYSARIADNTRRGADAAEETNSFIQDFLQSTHPDWTPVHE